MARAAASDADGPQSPGELFAVLVRLSDDIPPDAAFLAQARRNVADRLNLSPEQSQGLFGQPEADPLRDTRFESHLRKLLDNANFGPDLRATLLDEDACLIRQIWTREVNAHALLARNAGLLIVVNAGLIAFVYKFARALSLQLPTLDEQGKSVPPPGSAAEQGASLVAIVLDWYKSTGFPVGPDFPVTPQQIFNASRLTTAAEEFVTAHELAHHMLGHTQREPRNMLVNGHDVLAVTTTPHDEHEADTWGLRFILDALQGQDGQEFAWAYAGVELFFTAVGMLEEHAGAPPSDTHPPAAERLSEVRSFAQQITSPASFATLTRFSDQLGGWVNEVRGALESGAPLRRPGGAHKLPEVRRAEFEVLVEAATASAEQFALAEVAPFAVNWRMWDVPADVVCDVIADRLARAYDERDPEAVAELVVKLLPTEPLRRAVDERLPVPFLGEVTSSPRDTRP
jgi:hypothetical protein